ncbi:hypothetical protein NP493_830g00003 [Ridgeia piscesae]|uniref:Uncharacterized protein n=1 Tax=Ridgeia piscesae TaxID=27915 RepID=A0AAD9KNS1_RIDPI|nr:hypothetical protein NP493_830g00003 [Ridgeia piscesae]
MNVERFSLASGLNVSGSARDQNNIMNTTLLSAAVCLIAVCLTTQPTAAMPTTETPGTPTEIRAMCKERCNDVSKLCRELCRDEAWSRDGYVLTKCDTRCTVDSLTCMNKCASPQ